MRAYLQGDSLNYYKELVHPSFFGPTSVRDSLLFHLKYIVKNGEYVLFSYCHATNCDNSTKIKNRL